MYIVVLLTWGCVALLQETELAISRGMTVGMVMFALIAQRHTTVGCVFFGCALLFAAPALEYGVIHAGPPIKCVSPPASGRGEKGVMPWAGSWMVFGLHLLLDALEHGHAARSALPPMRVVP